MTTTQPDDKLGPIAEEAINTTSSFASSSGYFDRVQTHEPKSPPGTGLTFATWVQRITPIPLESGLNVTSARLEIQCRVYAGMLQEPQDLIDINMTKSVTWMMGAFTVNFDIDPGYIDLLGRSGPGLSSAAGYLNLGGKLFRIMDILVPFVAPDVWVQEA